MQPSLNGIYMVGGQEQLKRAAAGWKINVEFSEDGTTDWLLLRDVKESNPIDLAKYAVASKINHESAFKWWVPLVLQKRHQMINKVKEKYWQTTHKYGVCVPKTVKEALQWIRRIIIPCGLMHLKRRWAKLKPPMSQLMGLRLNKCEQIKSRSFEASKKLNAT